jgi:hypothetical protein
MVSAVHGNCHMDFEYLASQSFILLLPPPLFSSITSVAEVVVKLILLSKPLHVLTVRDKVL